MNLYVKTDECGQASVCTGNRLWIEKIGLRVSRSGEWLADGTGSIECGTWNGSDGSDEHGGYRLWQREYSLNGVPFVSLSLRAYNDNGVLLATGELLRDIGDLKRTDSFDDATFLVPAFSFSDEMSFFASTFGLGGSTDRYPGGYWPTVSTGKGPAGLPRQAFAPLVLYSQEGALAIAPANLFLTSPLVRIPGGVGRGLHGAIDRLSAGTCLESLFAFGEDVPDALMRLGDSLLAQGGKKRRTTDSHPLFSSLGWWNAYGGYYTEPIRQLTEQKLEEVVDGFKEQRIPVTYLGLDLWYPYEVIGKAICYVPDEEKYPRGIAHLAEERSLSTVLHLSSLSRKNRYNANGADPSFYREVALQLVNERGTVAWHDWLRTQQHLTRMLREDPIAAEEWFSSMANAFSDNGLDVLLCMQTMGMNLASTQLANIIAGRSHTDFLFMQQDALQTAAAHGHPDFLDGFITPAELHRQNLLMGMVLYSLGLLPFHDLFLTRPHPGLGGEYPEEEAVLRALSCGPVGIGDAPGMTDHALIDRLLLPDGSVAHPDHPPFPLMETVDSDIQAFFTEHRADDVRWGYLILLNTAKEELPFAMNSPMPGNVRIWNGLTRKVAPAIHGRLGPGRLAYYVLVPEREDIAPIGIVDKYVCAPSGWIEHAHWNEGWLLSQRKNTTVLGVISSHSIRAQTEDGRDLPTSRRDGLWLVNTATANGRVCIHRR